LIEFVGRIKTGHWTRFGRKFNTYEGAKMARGKLIEQSEIERIHFLKKEGMGPTAISKEVNRSVSAVHKILALNPKEQTVPELEPQS
jgi:hypothetical protein